MAPHPDHYRFQHSAAVEKNIVAFLQNFYAISDTPGIDERYVQQFATDATFVLGTKRATGHDEIARLRASMWTAVASRRHKVDRVFPSGEEDGAGGNEVMLYGSVTYVLKEGGEERQVEWAGRAVLETTSSGVEAEMVGPAGGEGEQCRFKFYQVYLSS